MNLFRNLKKHKVLVASLLFYIVILILLYSNRFESYIYYERIEFESSGAKIYANLYHPTNHIDFQSEAPLVIYAHGLGSQKDLDIRIPNELTKRGFYVASIDYRGGGESTGHLLDINTEPYRNRTRVPAIAQDCSKLLDVIERLSFYNRINSSQIAIVGHSLGGAVALMNSALDARFKVTITWAGVVNFSAEISGIELNEDFLKYNPANIINSSNPSNLLVIQSIYDTTVSYKENALLAQKLTNCTLINITEHLFGGAHYLFSDKVLLSTISWLESKFFGSTMINGPILLSYKYSLTLLLLGIVGSFITSLRLIRYSSKFFSFNFEEDSQKKIPARNDIKPNKKLILKEVLTIILYFIGFISIWIIFYSILGIIGIIIAPIIIILIHFCVIFLKYILTAERIGQGISEYIENRLKDEIKSQFHKNVLSFSFISAFIFLIFYISYSLSYPFAFFSPVNIISLILAYSIYPFYLAIELFYRKIIFPRLYFIRTPFKKTIFTSFLAIVNVLILMALSFQIFIIEALLVTYFIFLAVIIINSLVYEKTGKFSSVMISSFIIIQIFFGSAISNMLGIGSLMQLFI
ncbi:MAG: alpha/beta hydrolase family protein [Promethearchaeota archaeon]